MSIRHQFVSAKTNGGDATLVRPSNWNEDHVLTDLLYPTITAVPAADQANWNPAGWTDAVTIRAQPATASFVGGLDGGAAGRLAIIENDSTGLLCLLGEDANSTAANRFSLCCDSLWLLPMQFAMLIYNAGASRWELVAQSADARLLDARGALILPNTTTSVQSFGIQTANTATLSTIAPAGNGNEWTQLPRTQITNSTASGSSDVRGNALNYFRGSVARRNGFFFHSAFAITAASATGGAFVGMSASTAAITTLPDATANQIYCGIASAGQTTLRVGCRDGATNNPVDLGANFPVPNATAAYEVGMLAMPNSSRITYAVRRLDSRAVAGGELTANLPAQTQGLTPRANAMVGGTGAATTLVFARLGVRRIDG